MPTDEPTPPPMRSRSGMLPPDGAHWPPLPSREEAAPAVEARPLPEVGRRPDDATVADWRDMVTAAPAGYAGSASAPRPTPVWDAWCIAALALAAAGLVVASVRLSTLASDAGRVVALAPSALAVAFGLVGRRRTTLDPSRRGRWLAMAGVALGIVGVVVAGLRFV